MQPGKVAQLVACLTHEPEVPVRPHTFISPSADSRRAVVSYWQKYMHEVLVSHLGGLSLPRKNVVRLTDHPNMTIDIYCGRKTTTQHLCMPRILSPLCSLHKEQSGRVATVGKICGK